MADVAGEPKKKRGRPPGSTNKPKASKGTGRPRGRPKGSGKKGGSNGNPNLRQIIRDIVREELLAAFK